MRRALLLAATLLAAAGRLTAQDSIPAPAAPAADSAPPPVQVSDTARVRPDTGITYARTPVSPMGALWRSILIPGWGQAKSNRKLTGALFVAWEGVTLGMAIKSQHELNYLRRTGSGSVSAKEKERQDWLVLLAFNHLFSAIEAYVSAHLWDFPEDLEMRAVPLPGGGVGATLRVPFGRP